MGKIIAAVGGAVLITALLIHTAPASWPYVSALGGIALVVGFFI